MDARLSVSAAAGRLADCARWWPHRCRSRARYFGVLIAARREPLSFSSGDCEFLRQVSEHLALAAHQAQLHEALQSAYEDLRNTQQAVMQQERLRVLGQMASGIAHDINNAISPITLYADSLLENEPALSDRGTRQPAHHPAGRWRCGRNGGATARVLPAARQARRTWPGRPQQAHVAGAGSDARALGVHTAATWHRHRPAAAARRRAAACCRESRARSVKH